MMTKQELFDKVVNHLRKQNGKCENNKVCVYRNTKGMACAVGCLIPDSLYSRNLDSCLYIDSDFKVQNILSNFLDIKVCLCLLMDLQKVHDDYDLIEWEYKFKEISTDHVLIYTQPEVL